MFITSGVGHFSPHLHYEMERKVYVVAICCLSLHEIHSYFWFMAPPPSSGEACFLVLGSQVWVHSSHPRTREPGLANQQSPSFQPEFRDGHVQRQPMWQLLQEWVEDKVPFPWRIMLIGYKPRVAGPFCHHKKSVCLDKENTRRQTQSKWNHHTTRVQALSQCYHRPHWPFSYLSRYFCVSLFKLGFCHLQTQVIWWRHQENKHSTVSFVNKEDAANLQIFKGQR